MTQYLQALIIHIVTSSEQDNDLAANNSNTHT